MAVVAGHLAPLDPRHATAEERARAARRGSRQRARQALRNSPGPGQDRGHDERLAGAAGELEIVDLAAVPAVAVDELVVEDAEGDVDVGVLLIPGLRS